MYPWLKYKNYCCLTEVVKVIWLKLQFNYNFIVRAKYRRYQYTVKLVRNKIHLGLKICYGVFSFHSVIFFIYIVGKVMTCFCKTTVHNKKKTKCLCNNTLHAYKNGWVNSFFWHTYCFAYVVPDLSALKIQERRKKPSYSHSGCEILIFVSFNRQNHRMELWIKPFTYALLFFQFFTGPQLDMQFEKQLFYKYILANDYLYIRIILNVWVQSNTYYKPISFRLESDKTM